MVYPSSEPLSHWPNSHERHIHICEDPGIKKKWKEKPSRSKLDPSANPPQTEDKRSSTC